jgi:hypothetical protein
VAANIIAKLPTSWMDFATTAASNGASSNADVGKNNHNNNNKGKM